MRVGRGKVCMCVEEGTVLPGFGSGRPKFEKDLRLWFTELKEVPSPVSESGFRE